MPLQKPSKPVPKGPWEKRGGIPRGKFPGLFRRGPLSMPWSRQRSPSQRKTLGEKILKERFPSYYGPDIQRPEIQREIRKLRYALPKAKTGAEQKAIRETIVRLEEAMKRAGL